MLYRTLILSDICQLRPYPSVYDIEVDSEAAARAWSKTFAPFV
jgi:hypothetical protein